MTAVAITTKQRQLPADLEQEILIRIDRAGLHICEAELRYKLRWEERKHGSLIELLDELERQGLIESAVHFRLTRPRAARRRPRPATALRHGDLVGGAVMSAGDVQVRPSMPADIVGELERGGAGRPAEIARRLGPDWTEDGVLGALAELFCGGVVGHNHEVGFWWVA